MCNFFRVACGWRVNRDTTVRRDFSLGAFFILCMFKKIGKKNLYERDIGEKTVLWTATGYVLLEKMFFLLVSEEFMRIRSIQMWLVDISNIMLNEPKTAISPPVAWTELHNCFGHTWLYHGSRYGEVGTPSTVLQLGLARNVY